MYAKKLTQLLKQFSKQELSRFHTYISSPFFNENEYLVKLFQLVRLHIQNDQCHLAKEVVWEKIFKNTPYDDLAFRRLKSELLSHAYDFLAYKKFKAEDTRSELALMSQLAQFKLKTHYNGVLRQLVKKNKERVTKDEHYFYHQFLLEKNQHHYLESQNEKKRAFNNLEQADYFLDCYYTLSKLRHFCDALGYKKFHSQAPKVNILPNFLAHLETSEFIKEPTVAAYVMVARMLLKPDQELIFHTLKAFLIDQKQYFAREDLKTCYIHLSNYCIDTKINAGRTEFYYELFEIFKIIIEEGIVFENGILPEAFYKNIIAIGLHVKEFEWVEQFISHYTQRLPKANQENARTYNLANVYFHQGKYDKVIGLLREVEYQDSVYARGSKQLLLKTYYELEEQDALDSLIDSFRIYLRRNKTISRQVKQQYMNDLRFTKKLANAIPGEHVQLDKIKQQIVDCKAVASKRWLLAKLEELRR